MAVAVRGRWGGWQRSRLVVVACVLALQGTCIYAMDAPPRRWRILHVTDIHLDTGYLSGAQAHCSEPPCCRHDSFPTSTQSVLAARGCGEYQCDTPLTLLQSALDAARQANPDLVLWGGDTAPHLRRVWGSATLKEDTDERQRAVLDTFTAASQIFKAMFPSTPVLPQLTHGWLAAVADVWAEWLPEDARVSLAWGGYYTVAPVEGLRVAVLNTQVCHVGNIHSFVDGGAAARVQLAWLKSVLTLARVAHERVVVTGHIPPGVWSGCWGNYSAAYEETLHEYRDVLAAQLFGHLHSGSFRLLRSPSVSTAPAYAVAFVTPSLSPYKDQNPSFRLYDIGGPALLINNIEQYYLDLSADGTGEDGGPLLWSPGFFPRHALALTDFSAQGWQGVLNRMWENETFAKAYQGSEGNGRHWMAITGANNKELRDYLCALTGVTDVEYAKCTVKSEETLIRHYTGSQHTYVLTSMFSFHDIMSRFSKVMTGILPEDWGERDAMLWSHEP